MCGCSDDEEGSGDGGGSGSGGKVCDRVYCGWCHGGGVVVMAIES